MSSRISGNKAANYLIFCMFLLCTIMLSGCTEDIVKKPTAAVPLVKTHLIQSRQQLSDKRYPATVKAGNSVQLSFQVSGQIIYLPVIKGEFVNANQLVAKLDPREYQHGVDEAQAKYEKARVDLARMRELLRTATISRSEYDESVAKYKVAKARLATQLKILDDTKLKTPFPGLIANVLLENHESVRAKQPMMILEDITSLEIIIDIPEQDLKSKDVTQNKIEKGSLVGNVIFTNYPNHPFKVYLKEFETKADEVTQTYQVTLTMAAPKLKRVLPGMSATVSISLPQLKREHVILVPTTAVQANANGEHFVWLVNKENKAVAKKVTVGGFQKDKIQILSGLDINHRVIIAGQQLLTEGMPVRVVP